MITNAEAVPRQHEGGCVLALIPPGLVEAELYRSAALNVAQVIPRLVFARLYLFYRRLWCRAAAASGQQKTALCHQLGADLVIDYEIEDLYQKVHEATDGRGVDVVYDPVGGDYFDIARRLVAFEGRLLVVGFASGRIPNAPMNHALVKNYSIVGVHMAAYREKLPHLVSACYEELHKYLLAGTYNAIVTDTIEFDALPIALEQLANRSTTGRIVFTP